jgi:aryl-alcohol dehydrogenase-like predicted oxidoreductase
LAIVCPRSASSLRLKTDYLDLLQLHSPPAEVVGRDDWVDALDDLRRRGEIRYYGVSCDEPAAGMAALRHPEVVSIQCVVNLLDQTAATTLVPRAKAQGVATIARETLANGLLIKGEADLDLAKYCATESERDQKRLALIELRERARSSGTSLASLALKFVRELEGVSVTLIGARTVSQLDEALRAADT